MTVTGIITTAWRTSWRLWPRSRYPRLLVSSSAVLHSTVGWGCQPGVPHHRDCRIRIDGAFCRHPRTRYLPRSGTHPLRLLSFPCAVVANAAIGAARSEERTSELQSL